MRPLPSVVRSTEGSWQATSWPSCERWTSSSRPSTPNATAWSNAASVFSGPSAPPPRWANTMGRSPRRTAWVCRLRQSRARLPGRRHQPAPAVRRARDRRVVGIEGLVPQLAGDLLVHAVEALAVVREDAAADLRRRVPSRILSHQSGSARDWRAEAITSAWPRRRIASACSKVQRPPAVTTGVSCPAARTARRIVAASGTLRPNGPRASMRTVGMHSWPLGPV